jgi:hypothetical protein
MAPTCCTTTRLTDARKSENSAWLRNTLVIRVKVSTPQQPATDMGLATSPETTSSASLCCRYHTGHVSMTR